MPSTPRVSVIITTYNRAVLLAQAMDSVLAQTYRDFELLVADDGSTDETARLVDEAAVRANAVDPGAGKIGGVRYLQLRHSGKPEVARNRAVAQARGAFLAFLDDDDLWLPEKLARQMDVLERDEGLGYAYSDCRFLEVDGSLSPPLLLPPHKQDASAFENLLQGCFVHPSTVVMRRATFEAVGPFDETFLCQGDYLLWLRAAWAARVACLPQPLVLLRRSPAGLSEQRRLLNLESAILVLERLRRQQPLSWKQRWLSRRTLARWHATLGLRRASPVQARRDLLRSIRLNPLQRAAWKALIGSLSSR